MWRRSSRAHTRDMETSRSATPVAPAQLAWLERESARWAVAGLVDPDAAARIRALYTADRQARRTSATRLLLLAGVAFVGVGLLWLIAANLDQLPPLARWLAVVAFWVAALVGAEVLAARRARGLRVPPALVGALRLLAALLVGGVVFQAAQSLQVPAYEPKLVGLWALGALAQAYAVRGILPLLVGIAAAQVWVVWQLAESSPDGLTVVLAFGLVAVAHVAIAACHPRTWPAFTVAWRVVGVVTGLAALFAAAIPDVDTDGFRMGWPLAASLLATAALAVAGALRSRAAWPEIAGSVLLVGVAAGLVLWEAGADSSRVGALDWAHAAVSVTAYVVAALGVAALGIRHDFAPLTWLATGALVLFTTFQSFAVFARIIEGGWLFVVLGLVLVGSGLAFDRARRELAEVIA